MKCKSCGGALDLTMTACAACGVEVELGRLTGILGVVCRACDAYNEPGAKTCAACGAPLRAESPPSTAIAAGALATSPAPPPPADGAGPVVRSYSRPAAGATRLAPAAVLRPSSPARPPRADEPPALTPAPFSTRCPRCGAAAGGAAFCATCGQALGTRGAQAPTRVFGALAPGRARLVLERGEGLSGSAFPLDDASAEAGRSVEGLGFPDDPCLAPHHATFFFRAGALHVRDEGAPGGTYLRLSGRSAPLRAGDHVAVGDRLLRFAGPLPPAPPVSPDGTRRHGSPRPAGAAVVLEESLEGGGPGRVFVRPGPSVTIGRAGCAVNLGDDPFLSQAHAEILVEPDGAARVRDLGSSDGTYVRLPPRGERELRDGDCVRIGREILRVVVE